MLYCPECGSQMEQYAETCEDCVRGDKRLARQALDLKRYLLPAGVAVLVIGGILLAAGTFQTQPSPPLESEAVQQQLEEAEQLEGGWRRMTLDSLESGGSDSPPEVVLQDQPDGTPQATVRNYVHALLAGAWEDAAAQLTEGAQEPRPPGILSKRLGKLLPDGTGPLRTAMYEVEDIVYSLSSGQRPSSVELRNEPRPALWVGVTVDSKRWQTATVQVKLAYVVREDEVKNWAGRATNDHPEAAHMIGEAIEKAGVPEDLPGWRFVFVDRLTDQLRLKKTDGRWLIESPSKDPTGRDFLNIAALMLSDNACFSVSVHEASQSRCLSNMKQLAFAALMYRADWNDRLPPNWCVLHPEDAIYPYAMNEEIYGCPADQAPETASFATWSELPEGDMHEISDPSLTPMIIEVESDGTSIDWRHMDEDNSWNANWAFVDGHVKSMPKGYSPDD